MTYLAVLLFFASAYCVCVALGDWYVRGDERVWTFEARWVLAALLTANGVWCLP